MAQKRDDFWFESVDPHDLPAMQGWAEQLARGSTLAILASDLHVEPSLSAVVDSLTQGHSAETKAVVASGLQSAFRKTEDDTRPAD